MKKRWQALFGFVAVTACACMFSWLLLYDFCMSNAFGVSASDDLVHWSIEPDVRFPPDARHGSVLRVSADRFRAIEQVLTEQASPTE